MKSRLGKCSFSTCLEIDSNLLLPTDLCMMLLPSITVTAVILHDGKQQRKRDAGKSGQSQPCHVGALLGLTGIQLCVWMQTELRGKFEWFPVSKPSSFRRGRGIQSQSNSLTLWEAQWASVLRHVNTKPMPGAAVLTTLTLFHQRYNITSQLHTRSHGGNLIYNRFI